MTCKTISSAFVWGAWLLELCFDANNMFDDFFDDILKWRKPAHWMFGPISAAVTVFILPTLRCYQRLRGKWTAWYGLFLSVDPITKWFWQNILLFFRWRKKIPTINRNHPINRCGYVFSHVSANHQGQKQLYVGEMTERKTCTCSSLRVVTKHFFIFSARQIFSMKFCKQI